MLIMMCWASFIHHPLLSSPLTQIIGGSLMMRNKAGGQDITAASGRVAPDRRWFGNTRVISQTDLDR